MIIKQVYPVLDQSVRKLCYRPYPNHNKGCPNYGKKKGCPPQAQLFETIYDMSKPIYAIVNQYDFKSHVDKMKATHPNWSYRQLTCCLYWQGTARKQLMAGIKNFLKEHREYRIEACPEAMGVNVTETLNNAGITLEWPPKNIACQVALAGIKKEGKS